jgi:phage shock protein A
MNYQINQVTQHTKTLKEQRGALNLHLARTAAETEAMKGDVAEMNQQINQVTSHKHTLR